MCGIAACYNKDLKTTLQYLESSFKRLEYRGYDACGYCILFKFGETVLPVIHKYINQKPDLSLEKFKNFTDNFTVLGGLIHTRWASIGKNCVENTHPFHVNNIILAHNGNVYIPINARQQLKLMIGETDSEALAYLFNIYFDIQKEFSVDDPDSLHENVFDNFRTNDQMSSVFFHKDKLHAINFNGSLYYTLDGYIASDPICFQNYNNKYFILGNKEYIKFGPNHSLSGNKIHLAKTIYDVGEIKETESNMFAEIKRQVSYIRNFNPQININYKDIPRIVILACGSSYYAGQLGKKYIEEKCNIPVDVEYASEFLNQPDKYRRETLFIALSQSGETKDVIDAINYVKSLNREYPTLAICNRENSSLTHIVDQTIYIKCGIENAVAATISFTGQVLTLLGLAKFLKADSWDRQHLIDLSEAINKVIQDGQDITLLSTSLPVKYKNNINLNWWNFFIDSPSILVLGSEYLWPIAQEAALKIKEVTYCHAEAIPAGEMKHGPLALIDDHMCTFLLLTNYKKLDKVYFNAREILARKGKLIIISDESVTIPEDITTQSIVINLPQVIKRAQPLVHLVFMQMFAAQYGINLGVNINRPRSLAKSITV